MINGLSLFANVGIAETYLHEVGINIVIANELIEERANLPEIPIQPFVAGAARKTSHAVGQAANNLMGYLSGNGSSSRKHKPSASSSRQVAI